MVVLVKFVLLCWPLTKLAKRINVQITHKKRAGQRTSDFDYTELCSIPDLSRTIYDFTLLILSGMLK